MCVRIAARHSRGAIILPSKFLKSRRIHFLSYAFLNFSKAFLVMGTRLIENRNRHRRTHEGDENGNYPSDVNEDELDLDHSDDHDTSLLPHLDDPISATPEAVGTPEQSYIQPASSLHTQHHHFHQHQQQQGMYHEQYDAQPVQQQQQQHGVFDPQLGGYDMPVQGGLQGGLDMFPQTQGRMGPPPLPSSIAQQGY